MEIQLPLFNALCTLSESLPILTNKVPMMENIRPRPAIAKGKSTGAIPPKLSAETISLPKTMEAKIVAT